MEQEPLGDVPQGTTRRRGDGIYKRYIDSTDGTILQAAWLRAVSGAEVVGSCRECGGDLMPARPTGRADGGTDPDYPMTCRECGKEMIAPRGKTMRWVGERGKRRPVRRDLVALAKERSFGPQGDA